MTLPLRTLTNAGDPLCTPDGQVLSGVHVSFQLVDRYGVETDVWDALTHERVGGEPIVATTNEDGEFSIDLWPNSRGNLPTRYRCTVDHPAFKAFSGTVDHLSLDPLQWVEFMAASATIAPQDLGEMSLYRQELAAGLQTLGTAVGVAGASATASQGSATAAGASASQAASQAAAASASATAAAGSATSASTKAGEASASAGSAAGSASAASNAASAAAATVSGLQTALDGKVDASDPRLTDAREWTASTVDQSEAEAGTATTRRAWTAQRVRQAMLGWWGGFDAKATPIDADSIVIVDSAASNAPKRLSWANAVAKLRGTFVEGPASAVDGRVMVFDGASGKKAKSGDAPVNNTLYGRLNAGWSPAMPLDDPVINGRYRLAAYDTRNEFPVPYDVPELLVRLGARLEFKSKTTDYGLTGAVLDAPGVAINVPSPTGLYMSVLTLTPWNDTSGGMPMQLGFDTNSYRLFMRAGSHYGTSTTVYWVASTAVALNACRHATTMAARKYFYFKCVVAGTTGATEPVWPETLGGTVVDGTVTWEAVPYWTPWRVLPTVSYTDTSVALPNLLIDAGGNLKRSTAAVAQVVAAPATASSPGAPGQVAYDNNFIYQCVATNAWKRTPINTW